MRIFTHKENNPLWPLREAAVIVAENRIQAKEMLEDKLKQKGMSSDVSIEEIEELSTDEPTVQLLNNDD